MTKRSQMMRLKASAFRLKSGKFQPVDSRYKSIVEELEARGVMPKTAPALKPTRHALGVLGITRWPIFEDFKNHPEKIIIVAGTNGKGSVCATLETLLTAAGERVGLYTSPHLIEMTERFRIGGRDIDEALFCDTFEAVEEDVSYMGLTHFEMLTVMAAHIFASGKFTLPVDRIILEVGMGGLWDATNAIPHGACVITKLGIDHRYFLGKTLPEIAANKFAVVPTSTEIGRSALVVHTKLPKEVSALAEEIKKKTASRWIEAETGKLNASPGPKYEISTKWGSAEIALAGERGLENTMTALTMFEQLGYDPAQFLGALKNVRWPGRMELAAETPVPIYLSGDHNEQGAQSLLELLPNYPRKHLHVLAGIGSDKDFEKMLSLFESIPESSLYLTETPFKGRKIGEYGEWTKRAKGAWADPAQAFSEVLARARPGDAVLVTGSLYLVGAIRLLLKRG
ncbi:MAG: hypothetical protein ABL958_13055 [Bdellovibrionia bacterium]